MPTELPPTPETTQNGPPSGARSRWLRRWGIWLGVAAAVYLAVAYLLLPALWKHYEHHPAMEQAPKVTLTSAHIPGDPLNVALVGSQSEVLGAMLKAGWQPADPITLGSSLHIAASVLLDRSYERAPVSNLFVWGRKQDLAFEKRAGRSPSHRHHVRFWRGEGLDYQGRELWIGAITFDQSVGVSHRTAQITHHIAPDVDAERDGLMHDLQQAGQLVEVFQVSGMGPTIDGRNGGGDRYYTDGELSVGVLSAENSVRTAAPSLSSNPPSIEVKATLWNWLRPALEFE